MSDGDNLIGTLSAYQFQQQQVETALLNDNNNPELLQLKIDLSEVIKLTQNLIDAEEITATVYKKESSTIKPKPENEQNNTNSIENFQSSSRPWIVGDFCLAPWSADNCSRPGRIVSMESERGFCTVYFEAYDHSETVEISNIRRPPLSTTQNKTSSKARNKAELEKMKRKKHKKVQDKKTRFQEVEKAHEEDKQKWQSFFKSSSSKNKLKGIMKSGIANMPSIETGRVGSGNSDRAGKPVTKYHIRPHNYKK